MTGKPQPPPAANLPELRPWYREPWPWVAIAIPGIAVIGGLFTLYLAITHPDPLVVKDSQYREIRSELSAEPIADDTDNARDRVP